MVSCEVAGKLLGLSRTSMFEYAVANAIPNVRIGKRRVIRFEIGDLRAYAKENELYFDEELAAELSRDVASMEE